jgi:hypothetical protein
LGFGVVPYHQLDHVPAPAALLCIAAFSAALFFASAHQKKKKIKNKNASDPVLLSTSRICPLPHQVIRHTRERALTLQLPHGKRAEQPERGEGQLSLELLHRGRLRDLVGEPSRFELLVELDVAPAINTDFADVLPLPLVVLLSDVLKDAFCCIRNGGGREKKEASEM